jgi:hypothetical protein
LFTLFLKEDITEDGSLKPGVDPSGSKPVKHLVEEGSDDEGSSDDDSDAFEDAEEGVHSGDEDPNADDID